MDYYIYYYGVIIGYFFINFANYYENKGLHLKFFPIFRNLNYNYFNFLFKDKIVDFVIYDYCIFIELIHMLFNHFSKVIWFLSAALFVHSNIQVIM